MIMLQVFGIIFFLSFASCKDIAVEVCEMKTFSAICQQPDEVLMIKQALLGRMKKGKCMLEDFGFFNCSSDVKAEMDAFCTGRKECHVKVDDTFFTRSTPCHADLKNHLQLTYSCVKVLFPDSSCSVVDFTGSSSSSLSPSFPPSGFISSVIVEKTGCGLTNSPLTLRAGEGQRINLTLHDVTYGMMLIRASKDRQVVDSTPVRGSTEDQKTLGLHFMISGTCRVYATVRDSDSQDLLGRGSSICGSQGSVVNVFTSTSNVIEIRFMGAQKVKDSRQSSSSSSSSPSSPAVSVDEILKSPQFLFQYSVIGCSESELPKETWKRKSGDGRSVILGCPGSDVTWEMICNQNNQWEGHARECSQSDFKILSDFKICDLILSELKSENE